MTDDRKIKDLFKQAIIEVIEKKIVQLEGLKKVEKLLTKADFRGI